MVSFPGSLGLGVALLALSACGDRSSGDTSTSAGSTSTGDPAVSTGEPTPTTDGPGSTGSTGSTTGIVSTTGDGSTGDSSESGVLETTGDVACGLVEQACAAVEAFGAYDDCGVVDPWNDAAPAWQAARDCALAAAKEQRAFKLVTWLQGFDSQVGQAYVGLPHESFAIAMFHFDSDPCGGGGCGPVASQGWCDALVPIPECVVEPGGPCIACAGQTQPMQICGPQ